MITDEVEEIFAAATTACETFTSKPTYAGIDRFEEKVNSILVKLPREQDGDEHGMLYLSQDPSEYGKITRGSTLQYIGTLTAWDNSIDLSGSDAERKKVEVLWKVKFNDSKVEAAVECGAKKMLLATFDNTHANKLKHSIKLHAGVLYFQLIPHVRKKYRKLHQLSVSELLSELISYFDINDGFARHDEKMKEAQNIAATVDADLINNETLLRMVIEAMRECGLFEKALEFSTNTIYDGNTTRCSRPRIRIQK